MEPLLEEDASAMDKSIGFTNRHLVTHPTWKVGTTCKGTGSGMKGVLTGDGEETVSMVAMLSSESLAPQVHR